VKIDNGQSRFATAAISWNFGLLGFNVRDSHNFLRNIFWRQDKINAPGINGALGHVGLGGGTEFLRDGDAAYLPDAAQCCRPVPIVVRDNHRNQFAVPIIGQRSQKNRDHIRPT
jgi:hypothetical protein